MNSRVLIVIISSLFIIYSCTPAAPESTQTSIPTPLPNATIIPTPTLDPTGDPDGDSYRTQFKQKWGTDPLIFSTFEEIVESKDKYGGIYTKITISMPFSLLDDSLSELDIEKLNQHLSK